MFAIVGIGQNSSTVALFEVLLVEQLSLLELVAEGGDRGLGQEGEAIFATFTRANQDLGLGEVDVFAPECEAFVEAKAATIEQLEQEAIDASGVLDNGVGFFWGEDNGKPRGAFGPNGVDAAVEFLF
jgi:hypothetical protein